MGRFQMANVMECWRIGLARPLLYDRNPLRFHDFKGDVIRVDSPFIAAYAGLGRA